MNRTQLLSSATLLLALFACDEKPPTPTAASGDAKTAAATATTTATASAATTTAAATATATADASAAPSADASSAATATASAAGSATAGAKKFDCGEKGQKLCPMQGWMKGVMTRAVSDGDPTKLAAALNTVASKPVAGFGEWTAIAAAGAAKAKAGDTDGAKESCKKCHALYQKKYKDTMRDQPW
jgi:hypothetical protein